MFSLRAFIKNGYLKAVGRRPDYWIILNAAGYMDKGVLTQGDLEEIQAALDARAVLYGESVSDGETASDGEQS